MRLDEYIRRIPQPILVLVVLSIALGFFVISNPLKDECDVKIKIFEKDMRGILISVRGSDNKTKFAQIDYWKKNCKTGNSLGACSDYFMGLRRLADSLRLVPDKCMVRYVEDNPGFPNQILDGIKVFVLAAWGEAPPMNVQSRAGWLTSADITTFCRLKIFIEKIYEPEDIKSFRSKLFAELPDAWSDTVSVAERNPELRPKALKSILNPTGSLDSREVYEKSLFSYRCDMYQ